MSLSMTLWHLAALLNEKASPLSFKHCHVCTLKAINVRKGNCSNKIAFFFPPGLIVTAVIKAGGEKKENKEQVLPRQAKQRTLTIMDCRLSTNSRRGDMTPMKVQTECVCMGGAFCIKYIITMIGTPAEGRINTFHQ